ncbi:3-oxoacyl-[acyl-carrier-protein] synthase 2 [Verrucomicrobiota bacterium]|nr:3-oxoacyl-[acyl-carrier-protein] synthase 2 [Verrucomicrobiota bacterium]
MSFDPSQRRVVITGLGVISACGTDVPAFWKNICGGHSGARRVTRFETAGLPNEIAAEIVDFDFSNYGDPKKARRFERSIQYGIAAAVQAAKDAGLDLAKLDADRVGVVEASSVGGMESSFKGQTVYEEKGYRGMSPFTLINAYCGGGSGEVALELGCKGMAVTYSSGSASGNDVMGYAASLIQRDEVDVMVAGGSEAPLLAPLWGAFCQMKVMTKRNDDPQHSMRPFDRSRDGFLLGEGSAFLVLEELSHALNRGAPIYAEVLGHGRSCEAHHSVAPHPEGVGMYRAMEKALRQARLHASEISYINAHGTATDTNDQVESLAIKKLFGPHARRVAISGTKPVTGHMLAAAGAIETVICALAIKHQILPPTINFQEPADGCDLDYIPNQARAYPTRVAMNLNVGFGGKNSCLILREYQAY